MIIVTDNGAVQVGALEEAPTRAPAPQLAFSWTGTDGTAWDLVDGPVGLLSGARGFGMPTPQHWLRENLLHGAMSSGGRFPARDVYMPVEVRSPDMIEAERSFFAGLEPFSDGRLRVTTPDARWREIACRYVEGAEGEYEMDPMLAGYSVHPIRMMALDPFWQGAPIEARFEYPTATPSFFSGPPFRLAPNQVLGNSFLTNPGDVGAYAVGRIEGPFTGFEVEIGDTLVSMTRTMTETGWVEIDTNPAAKTIRSHTGTNLRSEATEVSMAPIPPGEVAVNATVYGASAGTAVQVSFTPRHFRAW